MKHQSSQPAWAAYAHTPLNIFYAAQQLPQGRTLSAL
jgi:hypothetical protein